MWLLAVGVIVGYSPTAWAQELFVANHDNNSITVYSRTASGDTVPLRTISGGSTGLDGPKGLALDAGSSVGIPTLSEWAQIGMMVLLLTGGLLALRRGSG